MYSRVAAMLLTAALLGNAQAGELRDPMRPAGAPAAAATRSAGHAATSSLKLEGVIAGEKRVAIINGRLVRDGDLIAGARIVEIFATGVRVERAGKIQTLTLNVATTHINVRVARSDKKPEAK